MKKKIRNDKLRKWKARRSRVRSLLGTTGRTRLTVFRSSKHIYAQLVDAETGQTIAAASSRSKELASDSEAANKIETAKRVGVAIAKIAQAKNIDAVVFNRNGFLYHGRVKALAEGAREAGLQF